MVESSTGPVTLAVNAYVPGVVGVPEMTPVELRVKPGGSVVPLSSHTNEPESKPLADKPRVNAVPTEADVEPGGVMDSMPPAS